MNRNYWLILTVGFLFAFLILPSYAPSLKVEAANACQDGNPSVCGLTGSFTGACNSYCQSRCGGGASGTCGPVTYNSQGQSTPPFCTCYLYTPDVPTGTPTPQPPTSTPTPTQLPVGCPGGYDCTSSCPSGNYVSAGQACINYVGSGALCCLRPAPTAAPTSGPTSVPPPSSYCGDLVCNLSAGEHCGNCSDCGSCCTVACGGAACSSCGGGYCCGGEVCAGGGCCPAGQPYVCNGLCSAGPCTTPTPMVCPNVGFGSSPGSYCGSACLGCGITSDRYYDSNCNCVQQGGGIPTSSCQASCPTSTPIPSTPCPNTLPGGITNACRYSCLAGETVYGSPTNSACTPAYGGTVCCSRQPTPTPPGGTACPNNPPEGGTNACRNSCLPGEVVYGNPSNNDCTPAYGGTICCRRPPTTPPPSTPTPTTPSGGSCPAGSHSDSCLCGGNCALGGQTGCCANGTICSSVGAGYACAGAPTAPPPPPPAQDIAGAVFYDTDRNGQISAGESGAQGIAMQATGCDSFSCDTQFGMTSSVGNYTISTTKSTPYSVSPVNGVPNNYDVVPASRNVFPPASNVLFALQQETSITGIVFIDTDRDGIRDAGEAGYSNAQISISTGDCADNINNDGDGNIDELDSGCHTDGNVNNASSYVVSRRESGANSTNYPNSTNSSGSYTRSGINNATYQVYLTLPSGYELTTVTNPFKFTTTGGTYTGNFGINLPAPICPGGITANPSVVQSGETAMLSVVNCQNIPTPTPSLPPPATPTPTTVYHWDPDITPPPPGNSPTPTVGPQVDTPPPAGNPPGSRTPWTAPTCQTVQKIYRPQVTIGHTGNTTRYSTAITVPATHTLTAHVRAVTDIASCNPGSGVAYKNSSGVGASLHLEGSRPEFIPRNPVTDGTDAGTPIACLPPDNYQLSLQTPAGYTVVGRNVTSGTYTPIGSTGMLFGNLQADRVVTFCIAPLNPWFQTDRGDVRFKNLANPIPPGKFGSLGENSAQPQNSSYPGIFYSSNSNANLGSGGNAASSVKQWLVNNEYSYNADTENRNGGMSYDFFKAKALKDGVAIRDLTPGTFTQSSIATNEKVIYEVKGDLAINSYIHPVGRNIVILVERNVTIGGNINIPSTSEGVFIVAAKGNIEILSNVGTADPIDAVTLSQASTNLDGYYTAQGSIIIDSRGNSCADGTTSDRRLNVGGALIANSLKPFSRTGTGIVDNNRSLCVNNLTIPSLYIASRPDFLVRLTDFYKTSYTKWREVNP